MHLPVSSGDFHCPVRQFGLPGAPEADTVFLHGVLCSTTLWKRVAALDPYRRSLALPLPGHFPWTLDGAETARALDDFAFLDAYRDAIERMAAGPVQLVAHSTGSLVALKFAARHPDLVKRLVLTGAFACGRTAVGKSSMGLAVLLPVIGPALFGGLWQSWLRSPRTFALGVNTAVSRLADPGTTACENGMMHDLRRSDPQALRQVVQWLGRTSVADDLKNIRVPVTVLVSQQDPVVDTTAQMELARQLPNAGAVICNAGHLPMIEQPELMHRVIFADEAATSAGAGALAA